MSVYTYLLVLWLAPAVLIPTLGAGIDFLEHGRFNPENLIGFCLSLPFGPWATQFARVLSFPNAGEFFHLPTALAFTAVLGTVVYFIVARPRIGAYLLVPYAWLLIGWFTTGFVQLVNCLF
ncbi:MAG: hypothetical protein RBU21_00735 [FCB group bacterium]|jgi:hypothetical protein|nr:hypothetical protein [FCB group bacterium]